ncbi:DNA polymerase III subunit alpha [Spiroplasma sp. TIUS-1]|uniref:DNA polymerase III subunit alpha n=1 Tax=Spiroplasma sp. TIUS-1 TaxID=216963 RepID=UPI0013981258|nr:DNA polymerase III subunit alpha [Spiroplasma sp. TIUS-1]QHX36100.1 DNA polymerase III subunit alpha [Spiroplasma sp. TIUS-1]
MLNLLNVKTSYNFFKSNILVEDYIKFAVKNKIDAVFFADDNVMYGAAEFSSLAKKSNLKPIIGLSLNIAQDQIIFYAKNIEGYKTLSKISSDLNSDEKIDIKKIFSKPNNDLVVVYCPWFEINTSLSNQLKSFAQDFYFGVNDKNFRKLDGLDNVIFANEIRTIKKQPVDLNVIEVLNKIANWTDEIVPDSHYFTDKEVGIYINPELHIKNLNKIIECCSFDLFEQSKKHLMKYDDKIDSLELIVSTCTNTLNKFVKLNNYDIKEYKVRLDYELKVIKEMGFVDYFLIVWDLINYCKKAKIVVGPGRGSAAGSLVSFLLGITWLDPIKHGLYFERFLNTKRITMPDIDIDFEDERREEVLIYLNKKYGNKFASISTFQTFGVKNAIRECGKVLNVLDGDIEKMSKLIEPKYLFDIEGAIANSPRLEAIIEKYPTLIRAIKQVLGRQKQLSTHAAGVVFCDVPISEVIPVKKLSNGIFQTQFPMDHLEEMGLIKTDILGLKNLTAIKNTLNQINKSQQVISLRQISLGDKKTFDLLSRGETQGIFQFESKGMIETLVGVKPKTLEDLAVVSALYRPGPQDIISDFINHRNNKKQLLIDPRVDGILKSTNGFIVFQEQIMEIFQKIGGFSLGEADIVRRAIGKKELRELEKYKTQFITNSINNNINEKKAKEIWNHIIQFAAYGFNKSHALAYAMISYWQAYFKTNYPLEFFTSQLDGAIKNGPKTNEIFQEVKLRNITIKKPSVVNPISKYEVGTNSISMPLTTIKGISESFVSNIVDIMEDDNCKKNIYLMLHNLFSKYPDTLNFFDTMVYSGILDSYGISKTGLLKFKKVFLALQNTLPVTNMNLKNNEDVDNPLDFVSSEFECYGFYLNSHPVEIFKRSQNIHSTSINGVIGVNRNYNVYTLITSVRDFTDKNGKKMAFLTVEDETGSLEVYVFAEAFEKFKDKMKINELVNLKLSTKEYKGKVNATLVEMK